MDSFERAELISILKNKLSYDDFCMEYFDGYVGQSISHSIAKEFYEDYISSKLTLSEYKKATNETIS